MKHYFIEVNIRSFIVLIIYPQAHLNACLRIATAQNLDLCGFTVHGWCNFESDLRHVPAPPFPPNNFPFSPLWSLNTDNYYQNNSLISVLPHDTDQTIDEAIHCYTTQCQTRFPEALNWITEDWWFNVYFNSPKIQFSQLKGPSHVIFWSVRCSLIYTNRRGTLFFFLKDICCGVEPLLPHMVTASNFYLIFCHFYSLNFQISKLTFLFTVKIVFNMLNYVNKNF